ncbi:MerR family transcriptional regulator [Gandjariella thermophila]|uniref:MerR family transcriptional regulator n=1 Tax=Gandjariella thermophila TaxID=1931992 RepID=UPI001CEF6B39|nr:MerR family transcriptional regulator [Gandjariella thermophila]
MSITTTTMLAQQIASTRSRRRRPNSGTPRRTGGRWTAVVSGRVEIFMNHDARISSVLEVNRSAVPEPARSDTQEGLTIAEAARRTGVSVHTLRYYERAGLVVTTVDRTAGGRRRYQQRDLDWIVVCTKLRATGMPIKTIRRYAEMVSAGPGNEQERLALMEAHRADVTAKLAELEENLTLIDRKINIYRGRLAAGDADQLWAPPP